MGKSLYLEVSTPEFGLVCVERHLDEISEMKKERSSVLEYAQDPILLIKLRPGNIEQSKLLVSTVSH